MKTRAHIITKTLDADGHRVGYVMGCNGAHIVSEEFCAGRIGRHTLNKGS